ncbi:CGL118 [Auxenochlorella protothecoides x Auxenochlorella symbiontica]
MPPLKAPVTHRVHARAGLLGNPSDGFQGAVIAVSVANFWAEVTASPSSRIDILPSPDHDPTSFGSVAQLSHHAAGYGCNGGVWLLMAACHQFQQHCDAAGIPLPPITFALSYTTNIPRQAGLSGSSALVLATLRCLIEAHSVEDGISAFDLPSLALAVETSLGIAAGLQDRVVQTFGGCVYMDFSELSSSGQGVYLAIDPARLPPLFLIIDNHPTGKTSGQVHALIKERWLAGDRAVRAGMDAVAECAQEGWGALRGRIGAAALPDLMHRSFEARRRLYGDEAIGRRTLAMVKLARSCRAEASLAGSGGCVALCFREESGYIEHLPALQAACEAADFSLVRLRIGDALHALPAHARDPC